MERRLVEWVRHYHIDAISSATMLCGLRSVAIATWTALTGALLMFSVTMEVTMNVHVVFNYVATYAVLGVTW